MCYAKLSKAFPFGHHAYKPKAARPLHNHLMKANESKNVEKLLKLTKN